MTKSIKVQFKLLEPSTVGMKRTVINKEFTLFKWLLAVGIIGVLLAVIIPMAIRANINSKYAIVDKNAAELKPYAVHRAERSIREQDETNSTATLKDYYASLEGTTAGYYYFAFAYQGTASTTYDFSHDFTSFRTGILTLPALKNGELFVRIR